MDEGYIEVASQGMRLFALGPLSITTKHIVSIFFGALASLPMGIILTLVGLTISGPPFLPLLLGLVGLVPGIILALIPLPKRQTNLLVWLYRKRRFRFRTQTYVFDREFRSRRNFEVISSWLNEVLQADTKEVVEP